MLLRIILIHAYSAGVVLSEWKLLDDMINMDRVSVQVSGIVSGIFSVMSGIA